MRHAFKGNFFKGIANENRNHTFVQELFKIRLNRRASSVGESNNVRPAYFGFLLQCH